MKRETTYRIPLREWVLGIPEFFRGRFDRGSMYRHLENQCRSMFKTEERIKSGGEEVSDEYDMMASEIAKDILSRNIEPELAEIDEVVYDDGKTLFWITETGFLPGALKLTEAFSKMSGAEHLFDIMETRNRDWTPDNYDLRLRVSKFVPDGTKLEREKDTYSVVMTLREFFEKKPFGNVRIRFNKKAANNYSKECVVIFGGEKPVIEDGGVLAWYRIADEQSKRPDTEDEDNSDVRENAKTVKNRTLGYDIRFIVAGEADL